MSAPVIEVPCLVTDMPDHEYHARTELSSTGARQLLDSPARFRWKQQHPETSAAFDLGTAVHTKVLGTGARAVAYPDEHLTGSGNPSTKAATVEWAAIARAAGRVPVTPSEMYRINAMAEAVLAHPEARKLLELDGDSEVSVFATDPETGVACRARFDRLTDPLGIDLKTTAGSASATGFGQSAAKYGYPVQEAFYADTLEWVTGERVPMRFIVAEKAAPFLVAVHEFDEAVRMAARDLAAKARRTYAECLETDTWPGHGDHTLITELPNWWWSLVEDDEDEIEVA